MGINKRKISFCRLLEFAHRVVKVIQVSADVCLFSVYLRYFVVVFFFLLFFFFFFFFLFFVFFCVCVFLFFFFFFFL